METFHEFPTLETLKKYVNSILTTEWPQSPTIGNITYFLYDEVREDAIWIVISTNLLPVGYIYNCFFLFNDTKFRQDSHAEMTEKTG